MRKRAVPHGSRTHTKGLRPSKGASPSRQRTRAMHHASRGKRKLPQGRLPVASSRLPALRVLGKSVHRVDPAQLATHVGVVFRLNRLGLIEAAKRDVELIRKAIVLEHERGPAGRVERTAGLGRRPDTCWRSRGKAESCAREACPGHKRCSARAAANRAMTKGFVEGGALHLIADGTAEAASRIHAG